MVVESGLVVACDWIKGEGQRNREVILYGYRVSFGGDENVLKMHCGDLKMYHNPCNYTGSIGDLYGCELYLNKAVREEGKHWLRVFLSLVQFSSFQSLSHVQLFVTPWTAARQASVSITSSQSLLKLMSIELVMPSNHHPLLSPFSSCLQSFPASGSFQMS